LAAGRTVRLSAADSVFKERAEGEVEAHVPDAMEALAETAVNVDQRSVLELNAA
jgi:hypothetical protein